LGEYVPLAIGQRGEHRWGGFLSYGLLNLVIIGVGIGLVLLGARLA